MEYPKHNSVHGFPSTGGIKREINYKGHLESDFTPKHLIFLGLPFNILGRRNLKPWFLCFDFRECVFTTCLWSGVWATQLFKYQNRDIICDSIKLFLYLYNPRHLPQALGDFLSLSSQKRNSLAQSNLLCPFQPTCPQERRRKLNYSFILSSSWRHLAGASTRTSHGCAWC